MRLRFTHIIILLLCAIGTWAQDNVPFTRATDLYYGTAYSSNYNHQLWLTTEGLTYDPVAGTMEGTDGYSMRLDLFTSSATDLTGSYEIVGPNYADKPGCMNKKYTYWTYYEQGGFLDRKLTVGTCTITCTSTETYNIEYSVQEIDNGPTHHGTIHDIRIRAVTEQGKEYNLTNRCTNRPDALDESYCFSPSARKLIRDGKLLIVHNGHLYDIFGAMVE